MKQYFDIIKDEDITDNVVRALKYDSTHVSRFIESNFPWFTRFFLKQSFAIEGTFLHYKLENKSLVYKAFVLKKKKL